MDFIHSCELFIHYTYTYFSVWVVTLCSTTYWGVYCLWKHCSLFDCVVWCRVVSVNMVGTCYVRGKDSIFNLANEKPILNFVVFRCKYAQVRNCRTRLIFALTAWVHFRRHIFLSNFPIHWSELKFKNIFLGTSHTCFWSGRVIRNRVIY